MPAWVLPAIIGGTGVLNALSQERNNRMQMELAKYKYQKDMQMWHLQNEYNSPSAQMARLADAGLSPNLVYGGGNVTGNSSSGAPEYVMPRTEAVEMPQVMSQYIAAKQANAQIGLIEANKNVALADALNKIEQKGGIIADSRVKALTADAAVKLAESVATNASLDTERKKQEIALFEFDKTIKDFEAKLAKQGLTKNDMVMMRGLIQQMDNLGISTESIKRKFNESELGKWWYKIINE